MLLDEVTRAGGFLRQLSVYGDEQTSASVPVDLNKLVRDLGPVLKRVAGDDVEVELPRTMAPMNVDSRSDRVERLLVNLAAYGRERMPFGGRLKIELAAVTVDQAFIEKHPNVRQGPNALIPVTERRARHGPEWIRLRSGRPIQERRSRAEAWRSPPSRADQRLQWHRPSAINVDADPFALRFSDFKEPSEVRPLVSASPLQWHRQPYAS